MAEYIDLDTPLEVKVARGSTYKPYTSTLRELLDANHIPYTAADVVERKRGEWIRVTEELGESWMCSECMEEFIPHDGMEEFASYVHFCPNCGADMRGERR